MKKIFILILTFLMMFSNIGCTKRNSDVAIVTSGLCFSAEIVFDDMDFTCFTEISDSNKTSFTFLNLNEIEGLKVTFDNDDIKMEYNGLDYKVNSEFLNIDYLKLIYNLFKNASNSKNIKNQGNGEFIVLVDSVEYKLKVGRTGLPIEIECPTKELYVDIKNATLK